MDDSEFAETGVLGAARCLGFDRMERDVLRFHGPKLRVWNPARLPGGRSNRWYMAQCLIALWRSRSVFTLHGWQGSGRAR